MPDDPAEQSLQGVLLAAGRGVRAYPATRLMPKALLDIQGRTLIERNIEILRDELGIRNILVVVGHLGDQIVDYLSRKDLGVDLAFVYQTEPKGIGDALLCAEPRIFARRFVVMLADEFYLDAGHRRLVETLDEKADAVLCFRRERNREKVFGNFTGEVRAGRVLSLEEKPHAPRKRLMGVGTYLLNGKVFNYIRRTQPSPLRGELEITDVLSKMAASERVLACVLDGSYININSVDDLNMARYIMRERFFGGYRVSVVIPAYNEAQTIEEVVVDFKDRNEVQEVLVVDNNSRDKTRQIAAGVGARVVTEKMQGYGYALRRGLDEAVGDIVLLTEADGSFQARDVPKFLEYLKDCDMVIGTRTTRQMIEQGANMGAILRWGNVAVGKIIEALWWSQEPRFTDVGCTYRAIWKTSYEKIRRYLRAPGPEFSPEMMIAVLICRLRVIEIPVSYRRRLGGKSKHSGHFQAHAKTAMCMLRRIVEYRIRY